MSDKKIILFYDTETSGLEASEDQILSFHMKAVDQETGEVIDSINLELEGRCDIIPKPSAVTVNRINPLKRKGLKEKEAAGLIAQFIEKNSGDKQHLRVGGHNITKFDGKFVRSLLSRNGYDGKTLPLKAVDTLQISASMLTGGKLNFDALETKVNRNGKEYKALNLTSVANSYGIEVDKSLAHSAKGDVETNLKLWKAMGSPIPSEPPISANPKELSKHGGKFLVATNYVNGEFVKNAYYITGEGFGKVADNLRGDYWEKSAILVRLNTPKFEETLDRFRSEVSASLAGDKTERGKGLTKTSIEDITSKKIYNSPEMEVDAVIVNSLPIDVLKEQGITAVPTMDELKSLASAVVAVEKASRSEAREKRFNDLKAASNLFNYDINNASNPDNFEFSDNDELIPVLAEKMAGKSKEEKVKVVSELANALNKNALWAYSIHRLAEKYGYRNKMPGFESELIESLKDSLKTKEPSFIRKDKTGLSNKLVKLMSDKGISFVSFASDGAKTSISILDAKGDVIKTVDVLNPINDKGIMPKRIPASPIEDATIKLIGDISASDAKALRKGFEPFSDNTSFDSIKRQLNAEFATVKKSGDKDAFEALKSVEADLGNSSDEFIARSLSSYSEDDKSGVEQKDEGEPEESMNILLVDLREVDFKEVEETHSHSTSSDSEWEEGSAEKGRKHKCVACNRWFRGVAVMGMGPTCAKKYLRDGVS